MRGALLVLCACGSGATQPPPLGGTTWRFHEDKDARVIVAAGDHLYVGEADRVRVFPAHGLEEPSFPLPGADVGGVAIAAQGSKVLVAWSGFQQPVRFADLTAPAAPPWSIDGGDFTDQLVAAGIDGGWVVCAARSGGTACVRVDEGKVGAWQPVDATAGVSPSSLFAAGQSLYLITSCNVTSECPSVPIFRIDRDGHALAHRDVVNDVAMAAVVADDLIAEVLDIAMGANRSQPKPYRRIHGDDLTVDPLDVRFDDFVGGDGGIYSLAGQDTLQYWDGKAMQPIASGLMKRLLPPGKFEDLALRTWDGGLLVGWKYTSNAHDARDMVVWRPDPR